MESVIRAVVVYVFLSVVTRIAGRRTLSDLTPMDMILLFLIAGSVQQGLLGEDFSFINAALIICTLILLDILLSHVISRWPPFGYWMEGTPVVICENGKCLTGKMKNFRISEDDVLEAARTLHGLERMDQIRYAIMETNGKISIIPREKPQEL